MDDPINSDKLLIALVLSIIGYAVVYHVQFGQWCMAMWAGPYPPIFIGVVTSSLYKFLTIGEVTERKRREKEEKEAAEFRCYQSEIEKKNATPPLPPRNYW